MAAKKASRKVSTRANAPVRKVSTGTQKANKPQGKTGGTNQENATLPFGRMNYILLIAGVLIIGAGFLLMSLDDFVDATQFSISLYVAPIVVVAGFVEIIFAIMYKPKTQSPAPAGAEG